MMFYSQCAETLLWSLSNCRIMPALPHKLGYDCIWLHRISLHIMVSVVVHLRMGRLRMTLVPLGLIGRN
jgi:hypothetical protein